MSRVIPIDRIDPHPDADLFPHDDEQIQRLAKDIQARGITTPVHVSPEGERLAFSVKDADGKRTLAHMSHNHDPKLWLQVSAEHAHKALEHQKISDRAYSDAVQLRLAFMDESVA